MATQNLIDPREYERTVKFIEDYRLAEHDPRIALQLRALDAGNASSLDTALWSSLKQTISTFERFHHDVPFITAPTKSLTVDGYPVARQFANSAPILLHPSELARNLLVLGSSGSGKTNLLLALADTLLAHGYNVWFFDVKGDAPRLAVRHERVLVLHANAPIDLFARPPYLSIPEHVATIVETFTRATFGGQAQRAILHEILTKLFTDHERPTIHDALALLDTLPRKGDTYDRINAIRAASLRLRRLVERYPGLATRNGMPAYALCEHAVLFPFLAMSDIEEFLIGFFGTQLFHHHRTNNIRDLRTFISVEESLLLFRGEGGTSRISGNTVAELVSLTREFGIGWALSANAAHLLDPSILANIFTIIALNATSSSEAEFVGRLTGFTKEQLDFYRFRLTRGQALVRLGDRYRHPILATFDPWPHEKTIASDEWQRALGRIDDLERTAATREGVTGQQPALPAPPRPSPAAKITLNKLALNTNDERLLRFLAENSVALTTECDGHPQIIARSKKRLLTLGLIQEERITVRAGRGGQGMALGLTRAGYEWLDLTPGGAGRGGLQHQYLVTRIARGITHSHIEFTLRDKRIDLVFALREEHRDLLNATIQASATFTNEPLELPEHASIAIEVEATDPVKTAPVNAVKNAAVHIELTIIATLPNDLEKTIAAIHKLAPEIRARTILIDALALLRLTQIAPNRARL